MKISDTIDYCLMTIGATYSLANIEHILGITILIIQIIWLGFKFINKLIKYLKNKKDISELDSDVSKITDTIEKVGDVIGDNKPKE